MQPRLDLTAHSTFHHNGNPIELQHNRNPCKFQHNSLIQSVIEFT